MPTTYYRFTPSQVRQMHAEHVQISLICSTIDTNALEWGFYGRKVPACKLNPFLSGNTTSKDTVQNVRQWLKDCTLQHPTCTRVRANWLPTRLIDVINVRLCKTKLWSDAEKSKSYALLSHCWGSASHVSSVLPTVAATLAAHKKAIPQDKLPRTFRNTVDFTRSLGIPYLWIDSLCIVQDDLLDWEKEAAVMADIYENCHTCIAASTSPHSEGGLNICQDVGESQIGIVRNQDGLSTPLYMRVMLNHDPHCDIYPLATRGWVLQEKLLSPRSLFFGDTELIFECREGIECECSTTSGVKASKKKIGYLR
jgi:hypothetical protein